MLKTQANDKNFSIEDEFNPINEVKVVNPELAVNTKESAKPVEETVLDIKKDEPIEDNKWLNHNLQSSQKVNVTNLVEQEPKVISTDNMQNINDSIIKLMETTREGNTNVMKVQLYPEELGAVNITLTLEEGKLIAKILVENEHVKQLFTGKIELLSNTLGKQNINMESIMVELNNNANSNPNGQAGQNNSSFTNQNKTFNFNSESIETVKTEEVELNSGELSILA